MTAPQELHLRATELCRSLCTHNLITTANLEAILGRLHGELAGSCLAMLAELELRKNSQCLGNLEVARGELSFELMEFLQKRMNKALQEEDEPEQMEEADELL